jgi:response regulator RpfG family c-di-GMP phosphodiesterase
MSTEKAVAELLGCSGTQFDPFVVGTFCALIEAPARRRLRLAS